MKLIHYTILVFVFCLTVIVEAKDTRFMVYDKPGNLPNELFMYVNGELHGEIELQEKNFGEKVEVKGSGQINILFSDRIFAEDEEVPSGYPTMIIPEGWSKFLTIAIGDLSNQRLPLKFYPVNASSGFFENSDYLIANQTKNVLVGTFGEKKILVGPKKIKVYKMANFVKKLLPVKIDYVRENDNNKRRWAMAKAWRVLGDRRTLVFFYTPATGTSVKYFSTQLKGF